MKFIQTKKNYKSLTDEKEILQYQHAFKTIKELGLSKVNIIKSRFEDLMKEDNYENLRKDNDFPSMERLLEIIDLAAEDYKNDSEHGGWKTA